MKILAFNKNLQSNYDSHDWLPRESYFILQCKNCLITCYDVDQKVSSDFLFNNLDRYQIFKRHGADSLTCNEIILADIME